MKNHSWFARPFHKFHLGFPWCSISFAGIADYTCSHKIIPAVFPASLSGDYMVNGHGHRSYATVLTGMIIPFQNILAGKNYVFSPYPCILFEFDNAWERKGEISRVNQFPVIFQCINFFT